MVEQLWTRQPGAGNWRGCACFHPAKGRLITRNVSIGKEKEKRADNNGVILSTMNKNGLTRMNSRITSKEYERWSRKRLQRYKSLFLLDQRRASQLKLLIVFTGRRSSSRYSQSSFTQAFGQHRTSGGLATGEAQTCFASIIEIGLAACSSAIPQC